MIIRFQYRFEAAHRFLKTDSIPCMTPHGHTWHATLQLQFIGGGLNSSQMTVEFSQIKKGWKNLIHDFFDHSYMHNMNDPIVEVLRKEEIPPRLIPFPGDPTTELISLFMFNKMNCLIEAQGMNDRVQVSQIEIQETPTNTIYCPRSFFVDEISRFKDYSGWWTTPDLKDRSLELIQS